MALNKPTKQEPDKVNSRKLFFSNLSLFFALVYLSELLRSLRIKYVPCMNGKPVIENIAR
jgi:hypothetical protein